MYEFVLKGGLCLTGGIGFVSLIVSVYLKNRVVQARFRELDASFGKLFAEMLTKRGLVIPADEQKSDHVAFLALVVFLLMLFLSGMLLKLLRDLPVS